MYQNKIMLLKLEEIRKYFDRFNTAKVHEVTKSIKIFFLDSLKIVIILNTFLTYSFCN